MRLAASFAVELPNYFDASCDWEQLWQAWSSFCEESDELSSGFSTIVHSLCRMRALRPTENRTRFLLVTGTRSDFRKRQPRDDFGASEGDRPTFLGFNFESPVPGYDLPHEFRMLKELDVYDMQKGTIQILQRMGLTPNEITQQNYNQYHHALLYAEELQMKFDMALYDLTIEERLVFRDGLHQIYVPGLAEKRPSVLLGDSVLLKCKQGSFKGYVHRVALEHIEVSFHKSFRNSPPFCVQFDFQRTPLRVMHRAVDESDPSLLPPSQIIRPQPANHQTLNLEQRQFVAAAVEPLRYAQGKTPKHPPSLLMLWGPPGTGKTTTVVQTIPAIIKKYAHARILVTAPSNPAADLLCERLANAGIKSMLRLVAMSRDQRSISASVMRFTRCDSMGFFQVPSLEEMQRHQVVVATCGCSSYLRSRLPKDKTNGWFTHIFVDEAAQAMEAETLVPLTLGTHDCRLFLAGDWKQLGPVIRSPVTMKYGLNTSLMERFTLKLGSQGVEHSRVFTLLQTYRAHPSILKLYNNPIYATMLICRSGPSSRDMEGWPDCPRDDKRNSHPVIFHHCSGRESRSRESPSWMNEDELAVIKMYLMKLLAYNVSPEDIGIISPYHKQCQRLRYMCKGEGVDDVEVGTTELFQGREKRVILLSTVRSREEDQISNDFRFSLGFLGHYKRTNVALSRAKSMLIVVGNLSLLSTDGHWNEVIRLVKSMCPQSSGTGCLRGSSFRLQRAVYQDNGDAQETQLQAEVPEMDGATDRPWRDPF